MGNNDLVSETTRKVFLYGIPTVSGVFMMSWPGGLQLTFFFAALVSFVQSVVFRNAWFRNLVGIQPWPKPAAPKPQPHTYPGTLNRYQAPSTSQSASANPKGVFGGIKGTVSDIMKLGEKFSPMSGHQAQKARLTVAEKKHAKAYEERRSREIAREAEMKREGAQARFEKRQEQEFREQEKKERLQRRAAKKAKLSS